MKFISEIISFLEGSGLFPSCGMENKFCAHCKHKWSALIEKKIENQKKLHFILPAFPAKSSNRNKTLSNLPDAAEKHALEKLQLMLQGLAKLYSSGAYLTICSDGYVFNDIVGVDEKSVEQYQQSLIKCCDMLNLDNIQFFNLSNAYPNILPQQKKEKLVAQYAKSLNIIREKILADTNERNLFNGIHRFIYEDICYLYPNISKNQIRKIAKEKAYLTVQRSHAWSDLLKQKFPDAIRLSIHPHHCHHEKISIQMIPGENRWATPWHNVAVLSKSGIVLMKKFEALELNARLIENGIWDRFYILPEVG